MPVIAVKYRCDGPCHKTFKGSDPVAVLQGGSIMCEQCAELPRFKRRVHTWLSPTEQVTRTKKQKKLDEITEEPEEAL